VIASGVRGTGATDSVEETVQLDLSFSGAKPSFGDLFQICGDTHPRFPPSGHFDFQSLADLGIEQVDDYFAVTDDGDPVIWIFPLVGGEVVDHHPGPFDGLRLELGDPDQEERFQTCVTRFQEALKLS
jgi:hypothetical protein